MCIRDRDKKEVEIEFVNLQEKDIKPCKDCRSCRKPPYLKCIIDDDMQDLHKKVIESDLLVLATPVSVSYTHLFLGANIDAAKEAGNIGICKDNAYSFEASKAGVEKMYYMACDAVSEIRKGNSKKR